MKLKKGFVSQKVAGRWLLVSVDNNDFAGFAQGNDTTAFIAELLQEDTTVDKMVDALYERYDAPKETLRADLEQVLSKLRSIGAIEE